MRRCDKCKLVQNALTDFGNLGLSFLPSNTRGYSTNTETTCHTCKTAGTILPADCTRIRDQLVIVRVATEHPFLPTFRIVVTLQNSGTSNIGPEILDRLKENVVLLHAWSNVWFERMGDGGVYHVVNDINTITFSRDEVDTLDSTLELQLRMHGLDGVLMRMMLQGGICDAFSAEKQLLTMHCYEDNAIFSVDTIQEYFGSTPPSRVQEMLCRVRLRSSSRDERLCMETLLRPSAFATSYVRYEVDGDERKPIRPWRELAPSLADICNTPMTAPLQPDSAGHLYTLMHIYFHVMDDFEKGDCNACSKLHALQSTRAPAAKHAVKVVVRVGGVSPEQFAAQGDAHQTRCYDGFFAESETYADLLMEIKRTLDDVGCGCGTFNCSHYKHRLSPTKPDPNPLTILGGFESSTAGLPPLATLVCVSSGQPVKLNERLPASPFVVYTVYCAVDPPMQALDARNVLCTNSIGIVTIPIGRWKKEGEMLKIVQAPPPLSGTSYEVLPLTSRTNVPMAELLAILRGYRATNTKPALIFAMLVQSQHKIQQTLSPSMQTRLKGWTDQLAEIFTAPVWTDLHRTVEARVNGMTIGDAIEWIHLFYVGDRERTDGMDKCIADAIDAADLSDWSITLTNMELLGVRAFRDVYETAAANGFPSAMLAYAILQFKSPSQDAFNLYDAAARITGSSIACQKAYYESRRLNVGGLWTHGCFRQMEYLNRAADAGHADSQYVQAMWLLRRSALVSEADATSAVGYLQRAAANGHPAALWELASLRWETSRCEGEGADRVLAMQKHVSTTTKLDLTKLRLKFAELAHLNEDEIMKLLGARCIGGKRVVAPAPSRIKLGDGAPPAAELVVAIGAHGRYRRLDAHRLAYVGNPNQILWGVYPSTFTDVRFEYACVQCNKRRAKHLCTGCLCCRYCDRVCAKLHWKAVHRMECSTMYEGWPFVPSTDKATVRWRPTVEIAPNACKEMVRLKEVDGAAVRSIGAHAFAGCPLLKVTTFPNVCTIAVGAFAACSKLVSLDLGSVDLVRLKSKTFAKCRHLSDVVFPPNLKGIDSCCFEGTALTTFKSPPYVKYIGDHAFRACKHLQSVMLNDRIDTLGTRVFDGCTSMQTITFAGVEVLSFFNQI